MQDDGAELIVNWYLDLESRFCDLTKSIPLTEQNADVFLPPLSGIILEACSIIDAVFRSEFEPVVERKDANIPMFAKYYEPKLHFGQKRSVLYRYPVRSLCPFESWLDTKGEYKSPKWWKDYNSLKHDRLTHFGLSTFATALNALCALHQIISSMPDFLDSLMRHELIWFGPWGKQGVLAKLRGDPRAQGGSEVTVIIETELFGTPAGDRKMPEDLSNVNPYQFAEGNKLWRYLGKPV